MDDLKITLLQSELFWEDIDANLQMFAGKISGIKEPSDLIILPEMFNTGFTMNTQSLAEGMNGRTVQWLARMARESKSVICGSLIIEEKEHYYNRLIWMKPDGDFEMYDKRHLFRMANEQNHFTAGSNKIIVTLKGWKICPLVCYDLRFPVWSRNKLAVSNWQSDENKLAIGNWQSSQSPDYDALIYIASWPERRNQHWKTLLLARAIENQSYVIGVNRVGNDGNDVVYSGDSAVINAKGEIISDIQPYENGVYSYILNHIELNELRQSFPVGLDADGFEIF